MCYTDKGIKTNINIQTHNDPHTIRERNKVPDR